MKKEKNSPTKYELPEEIHAKEYSLLHISVRDLVEFVLRSGDIDEGSLKGSSLKAMQEGSRIHRKIQKQGGTRYHAEVPLKFVVDCEDYALGIDGRADGLVYEGEEITEHTQLLVDEIKGIYQDLDDLKGPVEVHLAQAKCYAYFLVEEYRLEAVDVQITYCNLDTEEIRKFRDTYSYEELHRWFLEMIGLYRRWSDHSYYFRITRQNSISALEFPFSYRSGQKELVQNVYRSIHRNKLLFVQAPTGTGKTVSTVFPAVKAVGENEAERIFYLTAKTVTRAVAKDTFLLLGEKGYRAKTVVITAKDKLCPLEERKCNPKDCPYAKGHFDRINDAVYDLLQKQDVFDADDISSWVRERMVCPFELNLDLSSWCDNIICDYNYVFDPNVYLKRFFSEGISCEGIFLIDEAHNLVERGREMYSETLVKEEFLAMKKLFRVYQGGIVRNLDKCNRILLGWKRETEGEYRLLFDISSFLLALNNLVSALERFFEKRIEIEDKDAVLDFYFKARNFLELSEGMDERYCVYCDLDGEGHFCLHLFCMDPSEELSDGESMRRCRALRDGIGRIAPGAAFLRGGEGPASYLRHSVTPRKTDMGKSYAPPLRDMPAKPAKYPLSIEYLNGKQIIYESTMCRRKNQKEAMPVNVWHGLSMNGFKCWKLFCP